MVGVIFLPNWNIGVISLSKCQSDRAMSSLSRCGIRYFDSLCFFDSICCDKPEEHISTNTTESKEKDNSQKNKPPSLEKRGESEKKKDNLNKHTDKDHDLH